VFVDELNHALSNLFVCTGKVLARRWHVIPFSREFHAARNSRSRGRAGPLGARGGRERDVRAPFYEGQRAAADEIDLETEEHVEVARIFRDGGGPHCRRRTAVSRTGNAQRQVA